MKIKKAMYLFIFLNIVNILFNYFMWENYTKKILIGENGKSSGDLSRLGYIASSLFLRTSDNNLSDVHSEGSDLNYTTSKQSFDIVTFGDSFSNAGGGGINPFYQDYIATMFRKRVLNLQDIVKTGNYLNSLVVLANSGLLDNLKVKTVIIESVERSFIGRMTPKLDITRNQDIEKVKVLLKNSKYANSPPHYDFMNNSNLKFLRYNFYRKFSDNGFNNIVYKMPLRKSLFSVENSNDLLFYGDDIKNINMYNNNDLSAINENLNRLASLLNQHNIKLVVLVAPNKYTIYSDLLIEQNKYGKSNFFEDFKKLPKEYEFIDSKNILQNAVLSGDKDIYYADDTHWSYKASELIVNSMNF